MSGWGEGRDLTPNAPRGRAPLREDERFDFARVQGYNQITDLYLLALAVRHGGRLVTFDQAIALSAVRDAAPQHLHLL